uniref:Golgi apparatus protein 1 n=1 Tax=Acanthochromis polyacanthus TaxID=80966 RepID=A0A3Q1H3R7_9TELE
MLTDELLRFSVFGFTVFSFSVFLQESEIAPDCNHLLWNYKLDLITDPKFESVATEVCKSTIAEIKECNEEERGRGYLVSCLVDHRGNISEYQCNQYITKMTSIIFSDFRLICGFMDKCRDDINTLHCGSINVGLFHLKTNKIPFFWLFLIFSQTFFWLQLQTLIQSADPGADYRIDRALNEACESVIQTACKHIRNGDPIKTNKIPFFWLFLIFSQTFFWLQLQTLIQSADPGADYRIDRALNEACESVIQTACKHIRNGDPILDPILFKKCQGDAARLCHTHGWNETSELMPPGAVFSCLYRHAYRTEEQGRRVRWWHKHTHDIQIDALLIRACEPVIQTYCHELECLQDHLEDLVSACRDVVGNLTELESEDIQIDALLIRACEPVIQAHCHEVADNQIDTGDLMECLVQNKHQKEMNDKCGVGVTHFQLIQMKDFRFSYKFKMACKEDVLRLCPNIKKKVDAVICLSTTVRNDTLQDAREQQVSLKCRKELRVEEVEMSEDIRLVPELYDSCKSDISRLCPNVAFGNAQVIECLKEQKKQLSQRCHQRIFRLQQVEMSDSELDYQLMRVCKHMIRRFCTESDGKNILQCLKQNKNSELMDPKCKQMITKRQITQNTDFRLNPVLRKACRADIPKFCQSVLNKASADSELEGQVIACLKLKYADQVRPQLHTAGFKLYKTIQVILQESALDYRLDPQLQIHSCALDIKHHCAAIPPGKGRQMSCLMEALQDKRVRLQPECKKRLQDRIDMWSYAAKVNGKRCSHL